MEIASGLSKRKSLIRSMEALHLVMSNRLSVLSCYLSFTASSKCVQSEQTWIIVLAAAVSPEA